MNDSFIQCVCVCVWLSNNDFEIQLAPIFFILLNCILNQSNHLFFHSFWEIQEFIQNIIFFVASEQKFSTVLLSEFKFKFSNRPTEWLKNRIRFFSCTPQKKWLVVFENSRFFSLYQVYYVCVYVRLDQIYFILFTEKIMIDQHNKKNEIEFGINFRNQP